METIYKMGDNYIVDIKEPFQPKSRMVTKEDSDYAQWHQWAVENPDKVFDCAPKALNGK